MNLFYTPLLYLASMLINFLAIFNKKLALFVNGRKESFEKLAVFKKKDKVIWLHAASLGEFEQGRPIIEQIKMYFPEYKILVTFFSPSGYEVRKDYKLADVVCYLPIDTPKNMKKFIRKVNPKIAIIIKYEFWPNLLNELYNTQTTTLLVSGIFRKNQIFFKWYGAFMRKSLKAFQHFFVQNNTSKKLLEEINFNNVSVSGDTRFDRVFEILQQQNELKFVNSFKNNTYTIVAGSTWKEDEELLVNYINNNASSDEKFIIAPHNINPKDILNLKKSINKPTVVFSEKEGKNIANYQVLIINTIGLLTKIYSYADTAYVGGGLATGLHNILEPATYGIPITFGGIKYKKFQEAIDLLELKGATIVTNKEDFSSTFATLKQNTSLRTDMGKINKKYIQDNVGATNSIMAYISKLMTQY
ncbi:3-deoxy-D-manno-octulosonic acid transferase [Tenacibaculum maritimum]|uniref:3-deoxy-D-manno-octulosonic acid transferase n=1 Tax=Tenacibaculum maritimum TaxID=107401 RepID=UPI00041E30A5|nr:glycosyltransferase N-terminal domain-containing protein [Tenacibaculum maritimum]MCD9561852.1 3-deoxy-D-manno-octulosonic acid transferase [Tenacibaculum maritimum]MCD9565034.1 3-deoxy-D-manno-octulosonic acid transferase [Tenacibaculum maritimum]MCD9579007.1 3-deoxy-D-manno-octulosonic acid transferase [Tenacibaculum maritimum]MCD9595861.1 3-deoxy-D-manno-octulosonic acid transferase [Tenacibaculum maritimum]MCD9613102.1 3-deoxy-D-manno-octulosonic acid transferase [Tenacibaculum maritimu